MASCNLYMVVLMTCRLRGAASDISLGGGGTVQQRGQPEGAGGPGASQHPRDELDPRGGPIPGQVSTDRYHRVSSNAF